MKNIQIVTKRVELKFDANGVAITDIDPLIEEFSKDYSIIDHYPSVSIQDKYLYITFKASRKDTSKTSIGFSIGTKTK